MKKATIYIFILQLCLFSTMASADILIPDFGDLNCDGEANVVDVQMTILSALGFPVNPLLDADANGTPDTCQDYASTVSGDCAVGQVIKWNGTLWACADDDTEAAEQGPSGPQGPPGIAGSPGAAGSDGKNSIIEAGPGPSTCPGGGKQLFIGMDLDGNGALGNEEISQIIEVCDGTDGEQGLPGNAGAQGIQGPKGEPGTQGPKGDTGAPGPAGVKGEEGSAGISVVSAEVNTEGQLVIKLSNGVETVSDVLIGDQGPKGDKGDTGAQGPQGIKGNTGSTGAQGPKGDKGDTGAQGPQGLKGNTGSTGAQGPKGDKGDTGPAGAAGGTSPGSLGGLCNTKGVCNAGQTKWPAVCAGNWCSCAGGWSGITLSGDKLICIKN